MNYKPQSNKKKDLSKICTEGLCNSTFLPPLDTLVLENNLQYFTLRDIKDMGKIVMKFIRNHLMRKPIEKTLSLNLHR